MNEKQMQKQKCEYCLYLITATAFFILLTYTTPLVDRLVMRDIMGTITAIASFVGMGVCIYVARFLSYGNSNLNRRLKHVYIMTALIMACTLGMGIAGVIAPKPHVWDIIYNLRALSVVLEVLAVMRFVQAWFKLGRD
jgi:fatty-acid desaturase